MKATIKDIAREAQVSITTVSLVLNSKDSNISQGTIDKVRAVAKQLNYTPSFMAVGMITKKTKILGLVLPDIANSFFAEIAKHTENIARENSYSVILCNANENYMEDMNFVDLLVGRGVDGLIIALSHIKDEENRQEIVEKLNNIEIPFVSIDRWLGGLDCSHVSVNHCFGGYLATKHLIENGHRRIGCITGNLNDNTAAQRLQGYNRALKEFGISYDASIVKEGDYMFDSGYQFGAELMDKDITAIFACNDLMAYGVYRATRECGKNVPDDISIVGFDDLFFSGMLDVPLTTIHQSAGEIAQIGCTMLINEIQAGRCENTVKVLEPSLVVRKSVAKI